MAIDDIVDIDDPRIAEYWDLPVNRVFGILASVAGAFSRSIDNTKYREDLNEFAEKWEYTGSNFSIMFALYAVMPQDSGQGFLYGIRAWEKSDKDFKLLTKLENPDALVSYVINTIDDIMELRRLQETIVWEGG